MQGGSVILIFYNIIFATKICLHVMIERPNSPPTTQANPPKRAPCIKTWKFNSNVEQRKRASFQIELYVVIQNLTTMI